jgi:hypothetical protein
MFPPKFIDLEITKVTPFGAGTPSSACEDYDALVVDSFLARNVWDRTLLAVIAIASVLSCLFCSLGLDSIIGAGMPIEDCGGILIF